MSLSLYLGRVGIDGAIAAGSHTLTSGLALFTSADIGRGVDVLGAGPDGSTLVSTITAVGSGTATLADAASTTVGPVAGVTDGATVTVWIPYTPSRGGVSLNNSLTNRDTMSFSADRGKNAGAPLSLVVGRPVLLRDSVIGDLFGGTIDSLKLSHIPGNYTATYECECVSWEAIASRRSTGQQNSPPDPVNGKFSGMAAGGIFVWLVNNCLGADVSAPQVVTGPAISEITFDYTTVDSAFDDLCKAATGDDTYIWRIDARRNPRFEMQSTSAAPWNISNSDILASFEVNWTREKYANRAIVTPKDSTGDTIDNTLVATYQVDAAVDERSSIEGGTGFYETIVSAGDGNSSMDSATLAESVAKSYSRIPQGIDYTTYRAGIRAGMTQSIVLSDAGISGTFLIESVDMSTENGTPLWTVHAVNGALIGDYRTALARLASGDTLTGFFAGGSAASATPPDNVTIGTITVEEAQYTPSGVGKGRRMVGKRPISIAYTPPSPVDTFRGVYVSIAPDDGATAPSMDGSTGLGTTVSMSGTDPQQFGPFAYSDTGDSVRVEIPEPNWRAGAASITERVTLISYSDDVTNDASTSPSATFTLEPPATAKPGAATAHCKNPTSVSIPATFADGTANPWIDTSKGGVSQTHLLVHQDAPDDPSFAGVAWRVSDDPDGLEIINASGPQKESDFELVFNTPTSVATYYVWACGVDADGNVNPIVPGETPMVTVTLGTADGTVDPRELVQSWLESAEFHVDPDTGKFSMNAVDFSKAMTGTFSSEFQVVSSTFKMKSIAADIIQTGVLEVGGAASGSTRVSRFKVFDTATTPNLIGWIGDDTTGSGYVGAWFKRILIGGSSPATAQIIADSSGNVAISGSLIVGNIAGSAASITGGINASQVTAGDFIGRALTLTLNGITTSVTNQSVTVGGSSLFTGLKCVDNSTSIFSCVTPTTVASIDSANSLNASIGVARSSLEAIVSASSGSYYGSVAAFSTLASLSLSGPSFTSVNINVQTGSTTVSLSNLPTSNPGAGSKQLWADSSDAYRVKYAF